MITTEDLAARGMIDRQGRYTEAYWNTAVVSTVDGGMETIDGAYPLSQDVKWPGVLCPWGGHCTELKSMSGAPLGRCKDCGENMIFVLEPDTDVVQIVTFVYYDGSVVSDVDSTADFASPEIKRELLDEGIATVLRSDGKVLYFSPA